MMKFSKYITVFLIFLASLSFSQYSRIESMGGMNFALEDIDLKFDPFQLGDNPAFLWLSRKNPRLDILQFNSGDYGNYRRKFSSERNLNIGANVVGIQPLGNSGTFQGRANYIYDKRSNLYRTLKHDTYAGEAFYFTDTTSGDVIFNGPLFEFTHSIPINKRLSLGAVFGYGLLNGLKKVYTYGETVLRNVYGKIGMTYEFTNKFYAGVDFGISDIQERIVASDVNLFTVITYHYRGDNNRIQLSGSKQKYKISKKGNSFGGQIYFLPDDKTEIGIFGGYSISGTESIFPVQGMEITDGYSQFENYHFMLKSRRKLNDKITAGLLVSYSDIFSWSKTLRNDLLIWKWNYSVLSSGFGGNFKNFIPNLTFAFEYTFSNSASDSTKYIDNKSFEKNSFNHNLKFGFEYITPYSVSFRLGYSLSSFPYDFIYGGENVLFNKFTGGVGLKVSESVNLDLFGYYGVRGNSERQRDFWDINLVFRFNKFN